MERPAYPDDKVSMVEKALTSFFPPGDTFPETIYKAMRYSLFAGGKRFRPVLAVTSAETFGAESSLALPTACAIEYIHTYSLIHDDLPAVDNDDYRRGRPTCHKVFGEDIAIMAGDALFAEAFSLIARLQKGPDSGRIREVIREIAEASGAGGMVGGQVVDMISTDKAVDIDTVLYIHTHKTGRLMRAAAVSGAILAGASSKDIDRVADFADHLGLAFQITDDILDEVGSLDELGKEPGADQRQHKATFPSVLGLTGARDYARDEIDAAHRALKALGRDVRGLAELAEFVLARSG